MFGWSEANLGHYLSLSLRPWRVRRSYTLLLHFFPLEGQKAAK